MNTNKPQLERVANFPAGYGTFPYIILKVNYAVYMQIPIQINAPKVDLAQYPGTYLDGVSEEAIANYTLDLDSELHEILLQHCRDWKQKTEYYNKDKSIKLCLVTGPTRAHYFHREEELVHGSIPTGGTLLSITNAVIGMNVPHFIAQPTNKLF